MEDSWLCVKEKKNLEPTKKWLEFIIQEDTPRLLFHSSFLYWSVFIALSLKKKKNIYSAPCSFWSGWCLYMMSDWFPRQAGTLHTSAPVSVCLLQERDLHRGWNLVPTSGLWGSAFASSPVTTNNSWIAVNVSAAASPPSPLWTIGLHSTCTNRTLSWALHYQLCCIWYLRFPPHDAPVNWTAVIKQGATRGLPGALLQALPTLDVAGPKNMNFCESFAFYPSRFQTQSLKKKKKTSAGRAAGSDPFSAQSSWCYHKARS